MIKCIESHLIPSIDLFPQYIIDDDMYDIWNIFFATSYLVNKLRNSRKISQSFSLKVVVIPIRVVSIYNPHITFEYNIADINSYLKQQLCQPLMKSFVLPVKSECLSTMNSVFAAVDVEGIDSIIMVIDRRYRNIVHVAMPLYSKKKQLTELDSNYFISLKFTMNFKQ
eukprot:158752_1